MRTSVRITKRAIDVALSSVGLVMAAPLVAGVAAAVAVDSGFPVLFRQRRAGQLKGKRGNRLEFEDFEMLKFRTMRKDAEKHTGPVLAQKADPRITRVGGFLRKTRLDELPQLWNVLRGDMSLVGPRPERPELLRDLSAAIPLFEERMRGVKPGITGLAQINLGYAGEPPPGSPLLEHSQQLTNPFGIESAEGAVADEMRMKLLYDLAYSAGLESFTSFLRTELGIIFKTPAVMVRGAGR